MKKYLPVLLVLAAPLLAQARTMKLWSYQELYDKADLVVIAKPVSSVDTAERTELPTMKIPVVGLSMEFDIRLVMKGDKDAKKVTLHHYRVADPNRPYLNGPSLVLIDNGPNSVSFDSRHPERYLLFLHREADGRYSPVSGQVDPWPYSVQKLNGFID